MLNVLLCFLIKFLLLLYKKKFTKTSFPNFEAFSNSFSAVALFVILNSPRDDRCTPRNKWIKFVMFENFFLGHLYKFGRKARHDSLGYFYLESVSTEFHLFFSNSHVHDLVRATKGFQNHVTIMLERLTFLLAISPLLRTNNLTSKREQSTKK